MVQTDPGRHLIASPATVLAHLGRIDADLIQRAPSSLEPSLGKLPRVLAENLVMDAPELGAAEIGCVIVFVLEILVWVRRH